MKKLIKWISVVLCVFCLYMGAGVQVTAASPEEFSFYEDGEVVGFIGDSITHATYTSVNYVNVMNLYYLSRLTKREVEFRNLGAAGYKVSDILDIYDQDPAFRGISKAVIMLGTNEAILGISSKDYIGNMERLIARLKEEGLKGEDILIVSPPICEQKPRGTYDNRLTEYTDMLEDKTAEWDVGYLDIHTPMLELTEEIQKEDGSNTLTTDGIHPNTTGHMLIAYYILQAQGAGEEPLSGIFVPEEGEAQVVRGELTDFYRGERGISWTYQSETLPMAAAEELLEFRSFSESASMLYKEPVQVMGLSEYVSYKVFVGKTELGTFSGRELADGIELTGLKEHPLQAGARQIAEWSSARHQEVVNYRNAWVDIMMQRAVYSQKSIQAKYEKWRTIDEELRNEMYAATQDMEGSVFRISIVEEGYSVEELERDKKEAEEQAEKDELEKAQREAEEQAKREAEERAQREAKEQIRREAKEQAARELFWRRMLSGTGAGMAVVAMGLWKQRESVKI